jgi:hypothetical protein
MSKQSTWLHQALRTESRVISEQRLQRSGLGLNRHLLTSDERGWLHFPMCGKAADSASRRS